MATASVCARGLELKTYILALIQKVLKFTAKSEEGNLTFEVELEIPPDEERVEVND